ncbi:HD domain-containing phosphohydrolase [Alkalibacter saccharofermentans]|uniref:PAS domain S-box-containing protein/diguanylate cyclase (GGDEF) domain-containing protein n=1 Tax=Alkalibacter saccharofermentans DSM 14828 TaxID=1120975 RepID=A0A1M4Z1S7_9FIRM|nr:HD domain-containing phosphohydrolase [Alkalibacter saccharofermentans]SHF12011.1 PAS domain S-box-containing protein/diguanylate cyclase (GGDEF) domain-containing protein [Alkalibacter saccharofermentans DSM 14828]
MKAKSISIKTVIILVFLIALLILTGGSLYIVFDNWMKSAEDTTATLADELHREIITEVNEYMHVPRHIVEVNRGLIERKIVEIDNSAERDVFFINSMKTHIDEEVYSFSFGTNAGEYYGARKNQLNEIEVMINNSETNGESWYYSIDEQHRLVKKVVNAGSFDPRTRDWFKAAIDSEEVVFSPVYKHFVMHDLTVSAAVPIYDDSGELYGVLSSHMTLNRINENLEEISRGNKALIAIVERDTGYVIANSIGTDNFMENSDGIFERITVEDLDDKALSGIYNNYINMDEYEKLDVEGDAYQSRISPYQANGIDWLVISTVPLSLITNDLFLGMQKALAYSLSISTALFLIFVFGVKRLLSPIDELVRVNEKLIKGDLTARAGPSKYIEVGRLADSFNETADELYHLIYNLESEVEMRTYELFNEKERFRTTLLSVGDGVIATDKKGLVTVMNPIAENLTGWSLSEAKGKHFIDVFKIINEQTREICEDPVQKVLDTGGIVELANHTVLIAKNGRETPIEDSVGPIKAQSGKITGVVIVFRDFSDKKEKLKEIEYLSFHDHLTGLYNRRYMEDTIARLDQDRNLPLAIMVIDVNGLKLTNDAFGHKMGDELLVRVSNILKEKCRSVDIVGRMGGDEFCVLLPKTSLEEAEQVKKRILNRASNTKIDSIVVSLAVGFAVKENKGQDIKDVMTIADNNMYKDKLKYGKAMRNRTIETVLKNINHKYDQEQIHTERVSQYCEEIARAMGFEENKIQEIKTAGILHDIGKIMVPSEILNKPSKLTDEEFEIIKRHPETSYQILKSVDEYSVFAEDVLYHHERPDGKGYPEGLIGDEIPINSRIIAVADAYEAMTAKRPYQNPKSKDEALEELVRCSGTQFDLKIVDIFVNIMRKA